MQETPVFEYRYKNAIIRVKGEPNMPRIKKAASEYARKLLETEARKKQLEGSDPPCS